MKIPPAETPVKMDEMFTQEIASDVSRVSTPLSKEPALHAEPAVSATATQQQPPKSKPARQSNPKKSRPASHSSDNAAQHTSADRLLREYIPAPKKISSSEKRQGIYMLCALFIFWIVITGGRALFFEQDLVQVPAESPKDDVASAMPAHPDSPLTTTGESAEATINSATITIEPSDACPALTNDADVLLGTRWLGKVRNAPKVPIDDPAGTTTVVIARIIKSANGKSWEYQGWQVDYDSQTKLPLPGQCRPTLPPVAHLR